MQTLNLSRCIGRVRNDAQQTFGTTNNYLALFHLNKSVLRNLTTGTPSSTNAFYKRFERRQWGLRRSIVASSSSGSAPPSNGPVLVWFKHDLRVDDHPGLHTALAATNSNIIPFFCFDPRRYEQVVHSPASAIALSRAVSSLRSALQGLGSDLIVSTGKWEEELPRIVNKLGASVVITEEELEVGWKDGFDAAVAALPSKTVTVQTWNAALFDDDYSTAHFPEWREQRPEPNQPLKAPETLPRVEDSALSLAESLPNAAEILSQVLEARKTTTDPAFAGLLALEASAVAPRWAQSADQWEDQTSFPTNGSAVDYVINSIPEELSTSEAIAEVESSLQGQGADWDAELASELAAGEGPVMEALDSYLRYVDTSADSGGSTWQWRLGSIIAKFDVPGLSPDGCFPALFTRAMALGVVSRRRIYAQAMKTIKELEEQDPPPPSSLIGKLGWLLTSGGGASVRLNRRRKAAAAAAAAEAGDFHAGLARKREGAPIHGAKLRHWRWRGILTDYLIAKPETPLPGAPAVVLVHGFGAFSEHWRDNVAALAKQGFTVYAPTLPGYGRAEKPSVPYGQDLWRDFVADFVLRVVRRPAAVAGNSIGGFIAASVAADFPGAVAALVLVNSAGLLKDGYAPPSTPPTPPSPPLFVVEGVSRALFAFLQGDVTNQLKRVYPVFPDRADEWLGGEISRASSDPGALGVFRSVFYLPKPRALNYLVEQAFGGPALVLQGAKDPLNDAVGRAKELDRLCSNAKVVMLDAGHCPHDELYDEFNREFAKFLKEDVVGKNLSGGAAPSKEVAAAK